MASSLRVGIIGTGRAGRCQARAFAGLPGISLAALWNRTRAKAERLAADLKSPGLEVFDDWRRLIDRSRVDIVSSGINSITRRQRGKNGVGFKIERQADNGLRGRDFERSAEAGEIKQVHHVL